MAFAFALTSQISSSGDSHYKTALIIIHCCSKTAHKPNEGTFWTHVEEFWDIRDEPNIFLLRLLYAMAFLTEK